MSYSAKVKSVGEEGSPLFGIWQAVLEVKQGSLIKEYLILSNNKFISGYLNIPGFPNKSHVEKFALDQFQVWFNESGKKLPGYVALIVEDKGKITTNYPQDYIKKDSPVKTNVYLPQSLHEWVKARADQRNVSFSELIRQSLLNLKNNSNSTEKWFTVMRQETLNKLKKNDFYPSFLEVTHYLPNYQAVWDQNTLLEKVRQSELRRTGWPIGLAINGNSGKPIPKNDGVEAEYIGRHGLKGYDYWYLMQSGDYFFARSLDEDVLNDNSRQIKPGEYYFFDIGIRRIAEAIEHSTTLYKNLGVPENEVVRLKVGIVGVGGRKLSAWDQGRAFSLHERFSPATTSDVFWEQETALGGILKDFDKYVYEATKKLLVLFDFFEPDSMLVKGILTEYLKTNI